MTDNNKPAPLHPLVKLTLIVVLGFIGLWVVGSIIQGVMIAQYL